MMALLAAVLKGTAADCRAEIAGDEAFSHITWEKLFEDALLTPNGVMQSVCVTEHYIISIENTADDPGQPDTVSAYYRNSVDENGQPVQQYSLAKRVADTDWEHGNGMAYNPNTGEIYVALYTNTHGDNGGCLYVMDPNTLALKGKIKVSDSYNILGIGYRREENQYVIQTDGTGGYSIKILDENFQLLDDQGPADPSPGYNFQDLCVSGDYVINFPLTYGMNIGEYMHVYSLSRRTTVASVPLDFQLMDYIQIEAESICELEQGVFLTIVNVVDSSGGRRCCFYRTVLPYYFTVNVTGDKGTVTEGSTRVSRGESYPITYTPNPGYELSALAVDGTPVDIAAYPDGYTLENIQSDHTVSVNFTPEPVSSEPVPTGAGEGEGDDSGKSGPRVQMALKPADAERGCKGSLILPAVVVSIAVLVISWYLFVLHVRRERRRKQARAKLARQRLQWEMAAEED